MRGKECKTKKKAIIKARNVGRRAVTFVVLVCFNCAYYRDWNSLQVPQLYRVLGCIFRRVEDRTKQQKVCAHQARNLEVIHFQSLALLNPTGW